jgi:hypothetical protein
MINDFFDMKFFLWEKLIVGKKIAKLLLFHCPYTLQVFLLFHGMYSQYLYVQSLLVFIHFSILLHKRHGELRILAIFI